MVKVASQDRVKASAIEFAAAMTVLQVEMEDEGSCSVGLPEDF